MPGLRGNSYFSTVHAPRKPKMRPEHSHGPMLKHLLLLLLTVFTSGWGLAQADGVLIEGELRHKKTRDPLQNVTVTVMIGE